MKIEINRLTGRFVCTVGTVLVSLLGMLPATSATVIYSDAFGGSSATALNGLTVEASSGTDGGTLNAAAFKADGSVTGQSGNTRYAYLPLVPVTGTLYTLTLDINPVDASASSGWLAAGFTGSPTTSSSSFGSNAPWAIYRPNGTGSAFYSGTSTSGTFGAYGTSGSVSDPITLTLTLNTSGSAWTTSFSIYNLSTGQTVASGSYTYSTNPGITGIFIGDLIYGGTFDNFSLTAQAVPEPSAFALVGVALLAITCFNGKGGKSGLKSLY